MRVRSRLLTTGLVAALLCSVMAVYGATKFANAGTYNEFREKTPFATAGDVYDITLGPLDNIIGIVLDKSDPRLEELNAANYESLSLEIKGGMITNFGGGNYHWSLIGKEDWQEKILSTAVACGTDSVIWSALGSTIRKLKVLDYDEQDYVEYDFSSQSGDITIYLDDGGQYDTQVTGQDFGVCKDIAVDADNNVWLAFSGGIFLLDGSAELSTLLGDSGLSPWKQAVRVGDGNTNCIALDKEGKAYFGTETSGVLMYDGQAWSQISDVATRVTTMTVDKFGALWFATFSGDDETGEIGIYKYENGSISSQTFPAGVDNWYEVSSMDCLSNGDLVVGTLGGGVKKYSSSSWTSFTTSNGMPSNTVTSVMVQRDNAIWLGTNAGVSLMVTTTSPLPSAANDRHIIKSAPIGSKKGVTFYGALDGIFRASYGVQYKKSVIWEYATGGEILSSPAADGNGVLYFGSSDKNIYALYPNGTLKWKYATGGEVVSSPALADDGTVYVGSRDGYVYAISSAGKLKWRFQTQDPVYASPALALDGTVYIGSLDGNLYALNPDGTLAWSFATGGALYSSAVVDQDGSIIFGSVDNNVYSLNPDGSLEWSYATQGAIVASPAIAADGSVVIGSSDWTLYKIDTDGQLVWSYLDNTPLWSTVAIDDAGEIYSATCGAFRVYYPGVESFADIPRSSFVHDFFSVRDSGSYYRPGSYSTSGTGGPDGYYSEGYTGAVTTMITGSTVMFIDDGRNPGGGAIFHSPNSSNFEANAWPRFRHDARNTGNVAGSLAIPVIDVEMELPTFTCDVDGNGVANMNDFRYMLKKVVINRDDPEMAGYDFDEDGRISIGDVIELLMMIIGKKCDDSETMLAGTEAMEGALDGLSAEYVKAFEIGLDARNLTAEEMELVQAALHGVGASASLPRAFSLAQNSPNPFNPSTTIAYEVPQSASGEVNLSVFDIRGRMVKTLVDGRVEPGKHFIFWDGTDDYGRHLSSGVYFYRMRADSFQTTRKMVLMK